ncbi:hypothetical protein [Novosphingobium taihuense]|uniref:hypothetical protein n=1 Tax=Novosphingobium taihuense TaxID=260085 RepID=UPI001198F1E9|nr:hypothetical protein [Novosphingobium taihuense]TWH78538.1 hypothetical protein IQ25_04184 [Novosphingobium taihuense]
MDPADYTPSLPDALLALGRLDGALVMAERTTQRLFATRLLRDLLIGALRQEGHAFTDERFHAWFAGATTLSDEPTRAARPPRSLCEAILTELTHSSWDLLAEAATRFQPALLAPADLVDSSPTCLTAHQDALSVIAAAHDLIAKLDSCPNPLAGLAQLHRAAAGHVLFAPTERAPEPFVIGTMRLTGEPMALPAPRWALELLWGEHWHKAGLLAHALPLPRIIRLDAMRIAAVSDFDEHDTTREIFAATLCDVAQNLYSGIGEAGLLVRRLTACQPGKRRTSRAPALLELLAAFGPLRSGQLETLLGVSRLGIRTMLGELERISVLECTSLAGLRLYGVNLKSRPAWDVAEVGMVSAFSTASLEEYESAMADIDALLARRGVSFNDVDAT